MFTDRISDSSIPDSSRTPLMELQIPVVTSRVVGLLKLEIILTFGSISSKHSNEYIAQARAESVLVPPVNY